MQDSHQLKNWTGEFGDNYIERNKFEEWKLEYGIKAFKHIFNGLDINSILEIGSNIGLNLRFIKEATNGKVKNFALEPNKKAYEKLVSNSIDLNLEKAWNCDASKIPLDDSSIDLVFTAGVLIHIAPDYLGIATDEIVRVASKYVLCIEYFSHEPVSIKYQDKDNLLFKRDFGAYYLDRYPNIQFIKYGFLWQREYKIFDNLNWWLFKKNEE